MAALIHVSPTLQDPDHITTRARSQVLHVAGELDQDTAAHLWVSTVFAFEPETPIRIDMSQVTFMDSSAVGALLSAGRERRITIVNPSERVRRVLALLQLEQQFGMDHPTSTEGPPMDTITPTATTPLYSPAPEDKPHKGHLA